jgi:ABC-type cobalamin transport system permease subunit
MFRAAAAVLLAAVAHTATAQAITLTVGVAWSDNVALGQYDYFTAGICAGTDWTVTLTPSSGDPDLYVKWDTASFPGPS